MCTCWLVVWCSCGVQLSFLHNHKPHDPDADCSVDVAADIDDLHIAPLAPGHVLLLIQPVVSDFCPNPHFAALVRATVSASLLSEPGSKSR
jgi:hypothetical protein